jgi:CRP-like cAMP-binding protein
VKAYGPFETIVTEGKSVPGLHVVGGGKIELLEGDVVKEEASPGDFLFAAEVLSAGKAHQSARAGRSGALVLFASRSVAHEMLMSVPPLLEILAG